MLVSESVGGMDVDEDSDGEMESDGEEEAPQVTRKPLHTSKVSLLSS
jgi:hypothetical protein